MRLKLRTEAEPDGTLSVTVLAQDSPGAVCEEVGGIDVRADSAGIVVRVYRIDESKTGPVRVEVV